MEDNTVPSDVQTDRRAAIEAAFEQIETAEDTPATEPVEVPAEPTPVEAEAPKEAETESEPVEKAPVEEEATEEGPAEEKPKTKEARAPQSWKPDARETWASLPESAKREIVRREREIATTLQQSAEERRFASEITQVFQPYEAELRAAGATPKAVLQDLLNTSYVMRRGTADQRADMVAQIIEQHGVDLVTLNDRLMKKAPAKADPVAERLAQLEAAEQARQRQAQERQAQAITAEIDQFAADPKNEFFQDVAPMMVTFLEKGQADTLADAYEKAIWAHPETRKVLTTRQSQTQNKLAAASSVKGSGPKATAPVKKPAFADRRSALEAAFDQLSNNNKRF